MKYIKRRKVAIIGAGNVGASIAYSLTIQNTADEIILIDVDYKKAVSEAADIRHGIPSEGDVEVYAGDYKDCKDCDLIVITAGRNRKVGESRLDLISGNTVILKNIINQLIKVYTKGVIMLVSNPVDILAYQCISQMGLPDGKVFGTGCMLDTSRLARVFADYVGVSTKDVQINIVGEHGEGQIPIWSRAEIQGMNLKEYCKKNALILDKQEKNILTEKVKRMGADIIQGKNVTNYGIATCVSYLANAILNQYSINAPVSTVFQGEYGIADVSLSIPSVIGGNGVEKRLVDENWDDEEIEQLRKVAEKIKGILKMI